jgi:5'-nucleotidase
LIADAMLESVKSQGVQIAIQNGGGIRASLDTGEVTMGEILTILPFQNTLSTFRVSGATLLAALENGVSQVEEGAGRFPQVAGLTYAFDPAGTVGKRVSDVRVLHSGRAVPLDPVKLYSVVSNNYLRNGGDGYKMFKAAQDVYDFGPDLADIVAEYMAAHAPYQPYLAERIIEK